MHLDRNFYVMVSGKLGMLLPERSHHVIPLPLQHIQKVWRPRTSHPIGILRVWSVARASRKIHNHRYTQLFRQQNRLLAYIMMGWSDFFIRMDGIAMAIPSIRIKKSDQ